MKIYAVVNFKGSMDGLTKVCYTREEFLSYIEVLISNQVEFTVFPY